MSRGSGIVSLSCSADGGFSSGSVSGRCSFLEMVGVVVIAAGGGRGRGLGARSEVGGLIPSVRRVGMILPVHHDKREQQRITLAKRT